MSKNRKKKANLSPVTIVVLVMTALSLGTTGVFHAVVKNKQLEVVREIERVERRIKDHERDVANLDSRLGEVGNRLDLKVALRDDQSQLRNIPLSAIEDLLIVGVLPELASNE